MITPSQSLTFFKFFLTSEENKEETAKQVLETLKIIEDEALADKKFFGGSKIGLVDLSFGCLTHWFESMQQVVGLQILEPNTLPRLYQWTLDFKNHTVIKANLPDTKALLEHTKRNKEKLKLPKNT
ncbi:hypothetical protein BUALT_Bualt04G0131700 [Buddleja alternifolia]|uniref:GST C-terminal domain-containing protein n=1 Tax=Buddleja alternifolia TaxID=168488 RepID=A0AAV6XWT3_9LAMI|nr:hypothetical protein BUALT_Bualt04G0131700 [Buddleja alternifolia]